jgi:hypothetical protein
MLELDDRARHAVPPLTPRSPAAIGVITPSWFYLREHRSSWAPREGPSQIKGCRDDTRRAPKTVSEAESLKRMERVHPRKSPQHFLSPATVSVGKT